MIPLKFVWNEQIGVFGAGQVLREHLEIPQKGDVVILKVDVYPNLRRRVKFLVSRREFDFDHIYSPTTVYLEFVGEA